MEIVWDPPKQLTNLSNHGMDFADLKIDFFLTALLRTVKKERYKAIGTFEEKLISVIFVPLGSEAISVISMRPASRKERKLYEQTS